MQATDRKGERIRATGGDQPGRREPHGTQDEWGGLAAGGFPSCGKESLHAKNERLLAGWRNNKAV